MNIILKFLNRHYFTFINLILITVLAGAGTGLGYKILTGVLESHIAEPAAKKTGLAMTGKKRVKTSAASYDAVAERNLFNIMTKKDLKEEPGGSAAPDLRLTDLKLKLWGTIVAGKEYSRAIIEDGRKKKQELFRTGDTIQSATLKEIQRNRVILTVNGRDEALEVEQGKSDSRRSPGRTGPGGGRPKTASTRDISIKKSLIDESMQNLNQLMKDVRIRPHFKNGESDGLIVSGIKSKSVFRKLGLRNGDIITGVDGNKIESVDDAMKLYSGLKETENMKVDIKRRGREQTLNFNIEK